MTHTVRPSDPPHLKAAFSLLGLSEIDGARHEKKILAMFAAAGHSEIKTDETPWCAAFVRWCLMQAGLSAQGSLMARSLATYGRGIERNQIIPRGAIAVWPRGNPPSGHVNLVLDDDGTYVTLIGGNQSKRGTNGAVTISRSRKSEALAFRAPVYPKPVPVPVPPPEPDVEPDIPMPQPAPPAEHVPWWKKPFVWLGGMLSSGLGLGGASMSIDAQFLWGLSAFAIVAFVLFATWVYAFPPRGKFVKGVFK